MKCDSELMKPIDTSQNDPHSIPFRCAYCGNSYRFEELAERAVEEYLGAEAHISIKDGGDSPYDECPDCGREAYIVVDEICAACGYMPEHSVCSVCAESLSIHEQGFGGLCSYHYHVAERERGR